MSKLRLQIEETVTYTKFVIIEFPEGMDSDKDIDRILNTVEKQSYRQPSTTEDMVDNLKKLGVKVIDGDDLGDYSSPDSSEVEIVDSMHVG